MENHAFSSIIRLGDFLRHSILTARYGCNPVPPRKYDGSWFLKGLAGHDIPLSFQISSIADAYDAMISDRPYYKAISTAEAFVEIECCSNTQFDPQVVATFKAAFILGWEANPHARLS